MKLSRLVGTITITLGEQVCFAQGQGSWGGASGIVGVIFLGLVGWLVAICLAYPISRRFVRPRSALLVLGLVVVGPPLGVVLLVVLFLKIGDANSRRNEETMAQQTAERQFKAFIEVCQNRKTNIFSKVNGDHPRGLRIAGYHGFKGPGQTSEMAPLAKCAVGAAQQTCKASNIDFFDVHFYGPTGFQRFVPARDRVVKPGPLGYEGEYVQVSTAKYGLILGVPEDPPVITTSNELEVGLSTIRLIRLADGLRLAETQIYFYRGGISGEYGCPDFNNETSKMLAAVFE